MKPPRTKLPSVLPMVFFLLLWALPAGADIYRYVGADGVIYFTNTPTTSQYRIYRKAGESAPTLGELINRYALAYRLEEALVRAVIKAESNFDPRVVSRKGAIGIMQLLPQTAADMRVSDPFNPEENIRGGCRYLRLMLDQFGNDLDLALAAYNAGPGAVRRHNGIPPYMETLNYVGKVKEYLLHYRKNRDT